MSILTSTFPLTMSKLAGGPRFSTDIIVGRNGQEVRNALWQDALWKYNAAYSVKTRSDIDTLRAFFLSCNGREKAFLLQALDDYTIGTSVAPVVMGTASGGSTFQIKKPYTYNGITYYRTILRPSTTTSDMQLYQGGALLTYGSQYTYSTTTGVITFSSPPSAGTNISAYLAKFYTVVRFDTDDLDIDMLAQWVASGADYSLHQVPDIPMVEVRDLT